MKKKKFRLLKKIYLLLIAPHHDIGGEASFERELMIVRILGIFSKKIGD